VVGRPKKAADRNPGPKELLLEAKKQEMKVQPREQRREPKNPEKKHPLQRLPHHQ
jgi:hypothetical protein